MKKKGLLLLLLFLLPAWVFALPPTPWLTTATLLDDWGFSVNIGDYEKLDEYERYPEEFPVTVQVYAPKKGQHKKERKWLYSYRRSPHTYFAELYTTVYTVDSAYVFLNRESRKIRERILAGRTKEQFKADMVNVIEEVLKYGDGDLPDIFEPLNTKYKGRVADFVDELCKGTFVCNDRLFRRTQRRVVYYDYHLDTVYLFSLSLRRWKWQHGVGADRSRRRAQR